MEAAREALRQPVPVERMVSWAAGLAVQLSAEQVSDACAAVGWSRAPLLVRQLWHMDLLTRVELAGVLPQAWRHSGYPERCMERPVWARLFRAGGFTVNGELADRPSRPVTLYRGATREGRFGMAWSYNRDMAVTFRTLNRLEQILVRGVVDAAVYVATFEPADLLARLDPPGLWTEQEFVVSPGAPRRRGVRIG